MIIHRDRNKVSGSSICVLLDAPVVLWSASDADPGSGPATARSALVSVACLDRVAGASHACFNCLFCDFD